MIPKCFKLIIAILLPASVVGQELVVANSRQNILYTGVENPLNFALKSFNSKDVNIIVNRGIVRVINNRLVFKDCSGQFGGIKFYAKNRKTNKIIDSAEFRLKKIADPYMHLLANNSNEGAYLGKDILTDSYEMTGFVRDLDYNATIDIQEFKIAITNASQTIKIILNLGPNYSSELVDTFKNLQENDIVTFGDIKIRLGCENLIRTLKQKLIYQKKKTGTIRLD